MNYAQAAIIFETVAFFFVTIDLVGERRIESWESKIRTNIETLSRRYNTLHEEAQEEPETDDLQTGGSLSGGGIDTPEHDKGVRLAGPFMILNSLALFHASLNLTDVWGLLVSSLLTTLTVAVTIAVPYTRIGYLAVIAWMLRATRGVVNRFNLSGYMLWTGAIMYVASKAIQFAIA